MWGSWIDNKWISKVLDRCAEFQDNEYIFQSKNPQRFFNFEFGGGKSRVRQINKFMLGTTIETDNYPEGFQTKAPPISERCMAMRHLLWRKTFITIEPIMKFNLHALIRMIGEIKPEFVTIGADSKGHNLEEPSWKEVQALVYELTKFTEIRQKTNLERLRK